MNRRSCNDLGVCQVEAALMFDSVPCPQPCGDCDLHVAPIVVDGKTVALEVGRLPEPAYAVRFPFAPGAIEHHRAARRDRARRMFAAVLVLALASAVASLAAGYARGKGWI